MKRACQLDLRGRREIHTGFWGRGWVEPKERRPGRPRCISEYNMIFYLQEMGWDGHN